MATFVFDGSTSRTITFDIEADNVVFDGLDAADIVSINDTPNGVQIGTSAGTVLTLAGVTLATLGSVDSDVLLAGTQSNLDFDIGTAGPDEFNGNVVVGLDGDDFLEASDDGAIIYGNQGNDTVIGGTFFGDVLGDLRIYGGQGNDSITGFGAGSVVYGGLNGDVPITEGVVTGNVDILIAADGTIGEAGVTIYGGNGVADAADGADYVQGSLGNDVLFGNGGNDTIIGFGGADSIYGGAGDDSISAENVTGGEIFGGLGDDTIEVAVSGASSVEIYGNQGVDTISVSAAEGSVLVHGGQGEDEITGTVGGNSSVFGGLDADAIGITVTDATASVTVFGNQGDDLIFVSSAADSTVYGGQGDDQILALGSTGDQQLFGNLGNDTIIGGNGSDSLYGGQGEDVLYGGDAGVSGLFGGVGADIFIGNSFTLGSQGEPETIENTDFDPTQDEGPGNEPTIANPEFAVTAIDGYGVIQDFVQFEDVIDFGADITSVTRIQGGTETTLAELFASERGQVLQNSADGQAFQFTFTQGEFAGTTFVFADTDDASGVDQIIAINGFNASLTAANFSNNDPLVLS